MQKIKTISQYKNTECAHKTSCKAHKNVKLLKICIPTEDTLKQL